jgi:hypothetical protein
MSKYVHRVENIIYNINDKDVAPVGKAVPITDENEPKIWIEFFICETPHQTYEDGELQGKNKRKTLYREGKEGDERYKYLNEYFKGHSQKESTTILYQISLIDLISDGDRCVPHPSNPSLEVFCPSQKTTDEKNFISYWDKYQTSNLNSKNDNFYIDTPEATKYFSAIEAEKFGLLYPGNWNYETSLKNFYIFNGTQGAEEIDSKIDVSSKIKLNANKVIDDFYLSLTNIQGVSGCQKTLTVDHDAGIDKYILTVQYQIKCPNQEPCSNETPNSGTTDSTYVGVGDKDANITEG